MSSSCVYVSNMKYTLVGLNIVNELLYFKLSTCIKCDMEMLDFI